MKKINVKINIKKLLADTQTPVSIYMKIRDAFPGSVLLESSDYHSGENSYSFICVQAVAGFKVDNGIITESFPGKEKTKTTIDNNLVVIEKFEHFIESFTIDYTVKPIVNGLFGYTGYDAIKYMEDILLSDKIQKESYVPEINYNFYKYIIAINHFKNELDIIENCFEDEVSNISYIEGILNNKNFAQYHFRADKNELSNISDEEFKQMVTKGKDSCRKGDVFQIVLSRQFSKKYIGDEFNVYRALRSINPSPYLFYFDYGNYKIFGSSPESQLIINNGKITLTPIAGSIKRTGKDDEDKILAERLSNDRKESSEHVMLVDLARNDISRNANDVKVEVFREVQYYSHILHLVSKVTGKLKAGSGSLKVMADTFPAGTLSGAPKYKAMQLIDKFENQNRGFYGGSLGYIGFDGDINQAIMIRSFLAKNNKIFYQAGAGVIIDSLEQNELMEVNNKLQALKSAIIQAENL